MNQFFFHAIRVSILLLGSATFFLSPSSTSAALVGADLFAAGDQLLTRDTATGLDWLDLTATMNLSANDIQTGVGGWQSQGFVHATTNEVRTLFINSDPSNVVINTGTNPTSASNVHGAQLLLQLMGITHPGPSGNEFDILGNGIAGIGEPGIGLVHFADYGTNTAGTLGFFFVPDGGAPNTFMDAQVGNFLIRATPVPEPPTAWLLGAALAFLSIYARRRTSSKTFTLRWNGRPTAAGDVHSAGTVGD